MWPGVKRPPEPFVSTLLVPGFGADIRGQAQGTKVAGTQASFAFRPRTVGQNLKNQSLSIISDLKINFEGYFH